MTKLLIVVAFFLGFSLLMQLQGLPDDDVFLREYIAWQLRLPRLLVGLFVGGILGAAGAAYQTMFNNSLASPSTVGTMGGAMLGVALYATGLITFVPPVALALVGGLSISLLLMSWVVAGRLSEHELVLGGIALSLGAGAICTGLQTLLDAEGALMLTQWSLGHLEQTGYEGVAVSALALLVMLTGLLFDQARWELLALGEDWARSHGVEPRPVQLRTLGFCALGVSASVALCGPITFVGLLAPHLCRFFIQGQLHRLVLYSALTGAVGLALCDSVARIVSAGSASQIPVGAMSGALGAPLLIALMLNRSSKSAH